VRLPQNSLFAILLRSRWWVSALIALGVFVAVRLLLDAGFGLFAALPFAVIALVVLWRELRAPRGARLERSLAGLRELSWEAFSAKLEEGYRRQGYTVKRASGAADFELDKDGTLLLVAAKRWKASRSGVEPLKELAEAGARREARECIFACAAEVTDKARQFAAEKDVKILEGPELLALVRP
jgi:restriction system protein